MRSVKVVFMRRCRQDQEPSSASATRRLSAVPTLRLEKRSRAPPRSSLAFRRGIRILCSAPVAAVLAILAGLAPARAQTGSTDLLLGDIGGLRTALARYGATLELSEASEVFGNLTGGIRRGFDYDGLTKLHLKIDTDKAFGWAGGQFLVSALQIHGRNLSADNLDALQTITNVEADRATRLWELWYRQKFRNCSPLPLG